MYIRFDKRAALIERLHDFTATIKHLLCRLRSNERWTPELEEATTPRTTPCWQDDEQLLDAWTHEHRVTAVIKRYDTVLNTTRQTLEYAAQFARHVRRLVRTQTRRHGH